MGGRRRYAQRLNGRVCWLAVALGQGVVGGSRSLLTILTQVAWRRMLVSEVCFLIDGW